MFNDYAGQYEFMFVNQQYDFLMYIYYDKESGAYRFNCTHEEARQIARGSGRDDFDPDYWLKEAAEELGKKTDGARKTDAL